MSIDAIISQLFYFSLGPISTYRGYRIAALFLTEIIVAFVLSIRNSVDRYDHQSRFQKKLLHAHIIIVILLDSSCKLPLLKTSL